MKKSIISFILSLLLLIGLIPMTAITTLANEEEKTVTVKIAPATVNATFYSGTGADISKELATGKVIGNEIDGNYHKYVLSIPEGNYSYRATDGETVLGGMDFTVGSEEEQSFTLVRTNFYTTNTAIQNIGDYTMEVLPGSMDPVVCGTQYLDKNSRVVTPTLLWANGNAMLYNWLITLNGSLADNYGVAISINNTFENTLSTVQDKTFTLANLANYEIIAPKGAKVQMFNQIKNFNVEEILESSENDEENGMINHKFRVAESASLTYRVSMEGKITRAGYMGNTEKNSPLVITFNENENPKTTENKMDSDTMKSYIESSTFVNVNKQNNLGLKVNDTFRLRAYRGAWEIINTTTANIMIEPDFHYNIISGDEHISMTPASNRCTGNAKNNWVDIKGVSPGTAIVEFSYDAIIIGGSGTSFTGQYGATDPNRKSLIIIQVGEDSGKLDLKAKGHPFAWDTELDTVYTLDDTADFYFTSTLDGDNPTVSLSTDMGKTWKNVTKEDGYFKATGLVSGNNILKFTANGKTAYQVVRAAKVNCKVENNSRNKNDTFVQGDKLTVTFEGTYMAIPKMSGIYNPSAHKLVYGATESASKQCGSYDLTSKCAITLTLDNTVGEQVFEGGYIMPTIFSDDDPMGAHRSLTDAGIGANFTAVSLTFNLGVYPTLKFNVVKKEECDEHKWGDCIVTVKHTAAKKGEKRYTCAKCGEYKYEVTKMGACSKFSESVAALEPTCTEAGHTAGKRCSECFKVISGMEEIEPKGHTFDEGETIDNKIVYTCKVCGEKKFEDIVKPEKEDSSKPGSPETRDSNNIGLLMLMMSGAALLIVVALVLYKKLNSTDKF